MELPRNENTNVDLDLILHSITRKRILQMCVVLRKQWEKHASYMFDCRQADSQL